MSKLATKWIQDDAVTKEKVNADVAGDGLAQAAGGELDVNTDGSTLEVVTDTVRVKDLGITTAKLAGTSVTAAKLGSDVAGDGLSGGNGADLDVDPDTVGGANLARAINVSANGVAVKVDDSTIQEDGSQRLGVKPDGINATHIDETAAYTWSGVHDFQSGTIHVPTPSSDTHAVNKAYADGLRAGVRAKDIARALRNTNIAITGDPGTVDGVTTWVTGQRIVLTGQTDPIENGIWEVNTAGAWTRPSDFDTGDGASGAQMWIDQGTTFGETQFTVTTDEPNDIIDTNSLALVQTSGTGQITAGVGLTKSGNTIHIGDGSTGASGGINFLADDIEAATDNVSLEVATNLIQIKDLGVTTAKLAATSVTAAKLGSDVAGNGLTGGNGSAIAALDDASGGANLSKSVNVSVNGLAVKIDDSTIGEGASSRLEVKDGGVTNAKLNADVAGDGIVGGAGSALDLEINDLAATETTAVDADLIAIHDDSGGGTKKMTRANFLAGVAGETVKQEMHKITAGEVTNGFYALGTVPVNKQSVRLWPVFGPIQVNKQVVGATGATPDFDILGAGNDEVHFNNNGAATGLSADIEVDDIVIVVYED